MGIDYVAEACDGREIKHLFKDPCHVYVKTAIADLGTEVEYGFLKRLDLARLYDHEIIHWWSVDHVGVFYELIREECPGGQLEAYFKLLVDNQLRIRVS